MTRQKPTTYQDLFHLITPSKRFRILSRDPYVAEGRLAMAYRYFPGPVATRFLLGLRDEKKILGIRCPECRTVYVPPISTCGGCFERPQEWIEVGPQGVLESFTVTHYHLPSHPSEGPLNHGLIKLEGADTRFLHLLDEVDSRDLHIGLRVEAVFRKKRRGEILDIGYFRPVP